MECNKDDALKAAELAEKKYMQQDFVAARKFCNKALQLYPSLERAKQMLAVVEVHAAAHHSHIGLEDWYAVLQVDPCADEATIRKQYRKMALMLHPDKNRVVGAEPAFKIINEAWMVLSDKNKKIMYDVKRSTRIKKPENGRYATEQPSCSTQPEAPATTAPATAPDPPPSPPPPPPPPSANTQQTFWTQCPNCKIQYQYYRKFENYQLLCHRCQTGFIATDIGTPPVETSTWPAKAAKKKTTNGANGVNGESSAFQQMQQRAREREEKRREEERKKAEREREREEKRRLKEALKKAKEEDRRRELLEKQLTKLREKEEKEARKKNMEALRKKLKKSRVEEEDDDDDDDDEDEESDEARIAEESVPPEILRFGLRRSNRARKNVTYRDDDYDDEDGDGHPSKRARMEEAKLSPDQVLLRQELAVKGRQHVLEALRVIREVAVKSSLAPESAKATSKAAEPCVVPQSIPSTESIPTKKPPENANVAAKTSPHLRPCEKSENNVSVTESVLPAKDFTSSKKNLLPKQAEPCAAGSNPSLQVKVSTEEDKKPVQERQLHEEPRQINPELQQQQHEDAHRTPAKTMEAQEPDFEPASPEDDNVEEESHFLVPDPDFYNFDTDRKESYVREGQVWALYDDTDGMPRFYCEIKQLVSLNPFKVRLRWLERYVISDEADEWEAAGFTVTCGQFKCKRKTETEAHFNKFSHLMQVDRIHANVVSVYPKQGEIWAVYKDWSLKLRPDKVSYDMVEVVSSYVEAAGLTAVSLIKVEGYKTIFARGAGSLRSFRSKDLLRFSHKVPAHWMIGTEKLNAPHSCWELDTAATPSHLIFVNR
ncbi:uncharacterized protein LOC9642458 [Selaginella moellendorffii]|uniref:uncharacterized protein LOC9642458 n=1 Tax=Selaginella moellendorffii TaxID=88036 RepID=UPI000D1C9EDF|nr:uncharacterized protein LOC9642458 [Selaginella moellendorffii]|eukprot:XP_024516572.1 uncharacterized protein LOC9642458 [Selaginella moellendorffii]